jgi:shikimate dehydrogenase
MDKTNQNTYCVIGDPIAHSLSPEIHTFVFQNLNIECLYEKIRVRPNDLEAFVKESKKTGRPGFNITIPHKETVMIWLDKIDELAINVGAVNTVVNRNGKLTGYNTDVYGCRMALERAGWKTGKNVILLGAGGAARAVIHALNLMDVSRVILFDIVRERCEKIKTDFQKYKSIEIVTLPLNDANLQKALIDANLLINATPVGMWPYADKTPIPDPTWLPQDAAVFDLVPKPIQTRLLSEAASRGIKTIQGLSMLIAQALAADEIWLGEKIPEDFFDPLLKHIHQIMDRL